MSASRLKIFIIIASVFLLINIGQINLFSNDVDADSPPPDDSTNGLQLIVGDWHVFGTEEYTDELIDLTGNLYIHAGAVLTFNNVTLRMNSTDINMQYAIEVDGGGKFLIRDGDGDPSTIHDASNITDSIYDYDNLQSNSSDYRIFFSLKRGAYVEINNSFLREIGSNTGKYSTEGIYSESAELLIRNSTISNCYKALYPAYNNPDGARNLFLENSTINNCDYGIFNERAYYSEIKYNKFYNIKSTTIYLEYGYYAKIFNSTFYNCSRISYDFTIDNFRSRNIRVSGCSFQESYTAIYITNSYDNYFENCTFIDIEDKAFYLQQNGFDNTYCINNTFNNITGYTYYLNQAESVEIINNHFNDTKNTVIYGSKTRKLRVEGNTVENATNKFIYISGLYSYYVKVRNNTIDCQYMGSQIAIDMFYCHYSEINDNTLNKAYKGFAIQQTKYFNYMRRNVITGRGSLISAYGIRFANSDHITMVDNIISGFGHGIEGYFATDDYPGTPNRVYFGKISLCLNDFYLERRSNFNIYNVSFDPSSVYLDNSADKPTVKLFYAIHVLVSDTNGAVGGAMVTVNNATKQFNTTEYTVENGYAYDLLILNGTYQNGLTEYATPYNFTANVSGSIAYAPMEYIIYKHQTVSIIYSGNTYPAPPFNLQLELNYTSLDLTWECYVSDLKSYRVYRNDSSGGWVLYDEVISPPPGVMKKWTGIGQAINLVEYRYKIHHVDLASQEETNDDFVMFNDWVVADYKYFENRDMIVNGSLFVENGGELELSNVNLMMNGTGPSPEYEMIEIRNGGTLTLTDIDDNPETENDRSFINASFALDTYEFFVQPGGTLDMYNSHVQNSSVFLDYFFSYASIMIDGGYFEIHNSTILIEEYGIYATGIDNCSVYGTTFNNYEGSNYYTAVYMNEVSDVYIENSFFNQSQNRDIYAIDFQNLDIINNTFVCDNSTAIYANDGINLDVSKNNIKRTDDESIYIRMVTDLYLYKNDISEFWEDAVTISDCENIDMMNNTIHDAPWGESGLNIWDSIDVVIAYNVIERISGSWGSGMNIEECIDLTVAFNEILDCPTFGMYIDADYEYYDSGDVYVYNNTIRGTNQEDFSFGFAFFQAEEFYIFNNTASGYYYGYAFDSCLNLQLGNNSAYNCTHGYGQYGGEGIFYYGNIAWGVDYGFWFQWGAKAVLYNCTVLGLPPYTVYVNESSEVTLINPYFNLTKIYVSDKTCKVQIMWAFDLIVRDQFGIPQKDIFVRIRNIYGTIMSDQNTDSKGMIYNNLVTTRIQFYDSNLTYTPHTFEAQLGNHQGNVQLSVSSSATLQMQLENEAPSAFNIVLNPLTPKTTDDIQLSYLYSDPEFDLNQGTIIKWYKNGLYQSALDNLTTLPSTYTQKDDLWFCKVTPSDGADYGITSTSMTAIIYNTKPSVSDIVLKPDRPDSTEDLRVEYTFIDADNDGELGTLYKWQVKEGGSFVLKATTNVPVLNHTKTSKNEEWMVTIVPKDGEASGDDFDSGSIIINNTPPSAANAKISPEKPTSSDDISVVYDFIDVDSDGEEGTEYQWYKVPAGGFDFVIASGLTSKNVPSSVTKKGERWVCEVRPADGLHFGETLRSDETVIDNSKPQVSDLVISPDQPLTSDALSVGYMYSDPDGDNETDTLFEWLIRSGEIYLRTGLKFKQLPSQFTTKGDEFICEVTPFDGYTYGDPQVSAPVSIGNSAPAASNIRISPDSPRTNNDLLVNYDYFDENGDMESGTTIQWFLNDQHQADLDNSLTVDSSTTGKGELWYFTVTPGDGFVSGEQKRSPEVEIHNSAPEARSPKITNPNLRGDEAIEISYTYYDPDGDASQRTDIRWYKDGILQPQFNNLEIIPANETEKDQQWYFQIRVFDGNDTSGFNESFSVIIKNAKPIIVSFYPLSSPIVINETESVEFGVVVEDMDNDVIYYSWDLENQVTFESDKLGEDSVINYVTSYDDAGTYILNVTVEDWDVNSYRVYNEWTVIVNNNNRLPNIGITEPETEAPSVGQDGTIKFVIDESDEDTKDDLVISWFIDGVDAGSSSSSYTFTATGFSTGEHTVEARVYDGYDTVSKTWNVTVKDEGEDLIYGRTWDEWSVLLQVMVIIVTLIIAAIGFYKLRKKKGALHEYMKRVEAPMKNWQEDPDKSEEDLIAAAEQIEKDFKEGLIEDLQYFLLDRQIKENLREIRQERVDSAFSYLPPAIHKELEIMLDDGKLTENEYQTFIGILSQSSGLTPMQKEEIKEQLQRWRDVDKKRSETKSNLLNSFGDGSKEMIKEPEDK